MKISKRFPVLLAAVFLLGASALTLPGCNKREDKPVVLDTGHAVAVIVIYNKDTGRGEILDPAEDKKITLRKNKDWVVWASPDGDVEVSFGGGSPFDTPPKHEKKVLKSERAKNKGVFPYTAKLVLWGDPPDKAKEIDPKIEVVD